MSLTFLWILIMKNFLLFLIGILFSQYVLANVVITGTRIIYPEDIDSVTIQLANNSKTSSLVQSWIDNGDIDSTPETSDSPFYLYPPIVKIEGSQGQQLKIKKMENQLPDNVESVFYLNVLDIPKTADAAKGKNAIQLATRSRIKLFYRPKGLTELPSESIEKVIFQLINNTVLVKNNSQYHFTLASITTNENKDISLVDSAMIAPLSSQEIPLKNKLKNNNITISYVDDYGVFKYKDIKI